MISSVKRPLVLLGAALAILGASANCGGESSTSPSTSDAGGRPDGADGSSVTDDGGGTSTDGGARGDWTFTTLKSQKFSLNGKEVDVEFVRADRPDGGRSYLLYQHAATAHAPLVIVNEPYVRIDWTGEDADKRWAALGTGALPDVDAPDYNGKDQVLAPPQSPQDAVNANLAWTVNGFATIHAYARFYVGGTLEDDALDAAAPYFFARARNQEIDTTRIGSYGVSWGGMMTLFGARLAPSEAPPFAIVAGSPPSDFVDLWKWSQTDLPAVYPNKDAVTSFYSPYWRRSLPSLGNPPSATTGKAFTHAGLCPGLAGKVLALHDSWDVIIPVRQTEQLAAACSNVQPVYWPRPPIDYGKAAIDHGPALSEGAFPSYTTFTMTFLVEALAPADAPMVATIASEPALVTHLRLILAEQKAGHEVGYIVPRLVELTDPRLKVLESETQQFVDGAGLVARAINDVWKTSFDAAGVRTQLANGLPPPP